MSKVKLRPRRLRPRRLGINKGRAFYTRPDRFGEYLLVDYLSHQRKKV